ncbi:hypothetical protein CN112_25055 [Sinorhizobium meliloti]|nr:hypothetical protein CN112_25055 [Sinorhizobium meliloti]
MLIRLTTGLSGPHYSLGPGDEREFPHDEALRLVAAGYAVPVAETETERAVAVPAQERRGKRGKSNVVSVKNNGSSNG